MATDDCGYYGITFDSKEDVEALHKLICHEIHRIRYRLSSAWISSAEKDAIEDELWRLVDIETNINDQL